MAKKKFNKEERLAIIKKLSKIAKEREKASWEKHRTAYRPSADYQRAKILLESRNNICGELLEMNSTIFDKWSFQVTDYQHYLDSIRDNEIEHLVEKYRVNESDLEVEIILENQESPVDDLIERLLRNCLCK